MFTRRDALVGLALPCVAMGFGSFAAAPSGAKRVGLLTLAEDREDAEFKRLFLEILASKGWSVGNNLSIVHVDAGAKVERLAPLAEELVRNRVDLIVTGHRQQQSLRWIRASTCEARAFSIRAVCAQIARNTQRSRAA